MAERTPTFSSTMDLGPCPGCGKPMIAQTVSEVVMDPIFDPRADDKGQVNATVKVAGIRIQHDCIPKVTRG